MVVTTGQSLQTSQPSPLNPALQMQIPLAGWQNPLSEQSPLHSANVIIINRLLTCRSFGYLTVTSARACLNSKSRTVGIVIRCIDRHIDGHSYSGRVNVKACFNTSLHRS